MLVLTRRIGENIIIGDDITVTVLSVSRNQIRIGVNAPDDVTVHREEVYERIQAGIAPGEEMPSKVLDKRSSGRQYKPKTNIIHKRRRIQHPSEKEL